MSRLEDLGAWKIFESLCKTRNFSDTAAEFDVEVSTVSRAVTALEDAIGQKLIRRDLRPMSLTSPGEEAFSRIVPILDMHREMISGLTSESTEIAGKIRLSLAGGFTARYLMPMLMEFTTLYPDVIFDIAGGGNALDVLRHQADIGGASFKSDDPRLLNFPRGRNVYVPIASASYVAAHGFPQHPKDLAGHTVFLYDGSVRSATKVLRREDGAQEPVCWKRVVRLSNILAIKRSVVDGLGVCVDMPLIHCVDKIISGELVPILPGWFHPPVECFLVTTKSNWQVRRHRIFIEWFQRKITQFFLDKELKVAPYWKVPAMTECHELKKGDVLRK